MRSRIAVIYRDYYDNFPHDIHKELQEFNALSNKNENTQYVAYILNSKIYTSTGVSIETSSLPLLSKFLQDTAKVNSESFIIEVEPDVTVYRLAYCFVKGTYHVYKTQGYVTRKEVYVPKKGLSIKQEHFGTFSYLQSYCEMYLKDKPTDRQRIYFLHRALRTQRKYYSKRRDQFRILRAPQN